MTVKHTILFFLLFCLNIQAQTVQYNKEFQVNTYTYNAQMRAEIARLSDDKFVVCWQSKDQDGSDFGIFAQLFDHNAQKLGEEFRVNTTTESIQSDPTVCGLSDGGFVISWHSYGDLDGSATAIFAQIYEGNGTKQGDEFQVNTYTDDSQILPTVCGLTNGSFVVCWESFNQDGSQVGIFGQMYDSIGTKKGDEFQVNTYTDNTQQRPSVCALTDGGFVVCWDSYGQDEQYDGIFMQVYDSSGTKYGEETQVNTFALSFQDRPSIDVISDNRFVICWESGGYQDGSGSGIFGQMFDGSGAKLGDEFQVNSYTMDGQYFPCISRLADNGFVICWVSEGQDGDGQGIFAQMYDNNGEKNGREFSINSYTKNSQESPSVCGLSNGDFVICWQSVGQDGSSYGIVGKYYLGITLLHSLKPFSLIYPALDVTLYSTEANFQWRTASDMHINFPWELKYSIYLGINTDFTTPLIFSWVNDTTYVIDNLTPGQTYFWKVLAKNIEGDSVWSSDAFGFYVSLAAAIEDDLIPAPESFRLFPNYPNPFNPTTMINYQLPITSYVEINIYDLFGQKVVTLISDRQNTGFHQVQWDATGFASGFYFLTLEAGKYKATQKLLLVK